MYSLLFPGNDLSFFLPNESSPRILSLILFAVSGGNLSGRQAGDGGSWVFVRRGPLDRSIIQPSYTFRRAPFWRRHRVFSHPRACHPVTAFFFAVLGIPVRETVGSLFRVPPRARDCFFFFPGPLPF